MGKKAVLDIECFKNFTGGEIDHQITMIELFSVQSSVYLEELKEALEFNSNEDWHDVAHKLKGMSAFCGANYLRDLCEQAQNNHLAANDDKRQSLNQIEDIINKVNHAFQDYLKDV